jgi:hypothetical protein
MLCLVFYRDTIVCFAADENHRLRIAAVFLLTDFPTIPSHDGKKRKDLDFSALIG